SWVVKALMREDAPQALVHSVCKHGKWPLRRDVQIALLRNEQTPLARAVAISGSLPSNVLHDVLHYSRLRPNIKKYLTEQLQRRKGKAPDKKTEPLIDADER
ncbi:MAG: hypothetical protein ACRD3E_17075, partial [Terriglobales bacterium]